MENWKWKIQNRIISKFWNWIKSESRFAQNSSTFHLQLSTWVGEKGGRPNPPKHLPCMAMLYIRVCIKTSPTEGIMLNSTPAKPGPGSSTGIRADPSPKAYELMSPTVVIKKKSRMLTYPSQSRSWEGWQRPWARRVETARQLCRCGTHHLRFQPLLFLYHHIWSWWPTAQTHPYLSRTGKNWRTPAVGSGFWDVPNAAAHDRGMCECTPQPAKTNIKS